MTKVEMKIRNHPLVGEISDERAYGDGVWVYFKHGYCDGEVHPRHSAENCRHSIHEETYSACWKALRRVAKNPERMRCVDNY